MLIKFIFLILISTIQSQLLAAESPLKSSIFTEQFGYANDIASADLNDDGHIDLFVVSKFHPHKVYFGQAQSQFQASKQLFGSDRGAQVVLEDFDNDGDIDAWVMADSLSLVSNDGRDKLYINDGHGHFTVAVQEDLPREPRITAVTTLVAGDLDNDGDIDIIKSSDSESTNSIILKNDGNAQFSQLQHDITFYAATLADYDSDGFLDIWSMGTSLTIYLNDKKGQFNENNKIVSALGDDINDPINVINIAVEDIDGDGDLDAQGFMWVTGKDSMVSLPRYVNQADGSFLYEDITQTIESGNLQTGKLLDIDGDHDLDLWTISIDGQSSKLFISDESGFIEFNSQTEIEEYFRTGLTAVDLDNDGDKDVITVGRSGQINVWQNRQNLNFIKVIQKTLNEATGASESAAVADMNNDGHLDYVSADTNKISVSYGDGKHHFQSSVFSQGYYDQITTADFNSDGLMDIVVSQLDIESNQYHLQIWINSDGHNFQQLPQTMSVVSTDIRAISAADYDSDGDEDLLVVDNSQGIEVWHNDGSGQLTIDQKIKGNFLDAEFVDLYADKNIHILAINKSNDHLTSDINYASFEYKDGQFLSMQTIDNQANNAGLGGKLMIIDWDTDGDMDVLEFCKGASQQRALCILINNGVINGFERQHLFTDESPSLNIYHLADLNNDGLMDMIAELGYVLINQGDRKFKAIRPKEWISIQQVLSEDFDNDGDKDVLMLYQTQGLEYFINTSIDESDFNGLWYDNNQSGHGLQVEQIISEGKKQLFVSWYVYQNGQPIWLSGIGDMNENSATIDMILTEGADFFPNFNAEDVSRIPWGRLNLSMNNKDELHMNWQTDHDGFSNGNMTMQRLTELSQLSIYDTGIKVCHSGSWYNTLQSGHGMMVEIIGNNVRDRKMVMTWFTYVNGEQYWIVAQGDVNGDTAELYAQSASGGDFPPNFNSDDVEFSEWGKITFEIMTDTQARISWNPVNELFEAGELQVNKLTFIDRYRCD